MDCINLNFLVVILYYIMQNVTMGGNEVKGILHLLFLAIACESTSLKIKFLRKHLNNQQSAYSVYYVTFQTH